MKVFTTCVVLLCSVITAVCLIFYSSWNFGRIRVSTRWFEFFRNPFSAIIFLLCEQVLIKRSFSSPDATLHLLSTKNLRWLTTVLMEYKSATFNSFEKGSRLFFPSLFTVCLSLLSFYVKFEQLKVNKWPKWATEYPMRDWALVG